MINIYDVPDYIKNNAAITFEKYKELYKLSIEDPEKFWSEQAKNLDWIKNFNTVKKTDFNSNVDIKWFEGGTLNVSFNCLDRHLKNKGNKIAIIWEGDNPNESRTITYRELFEKVCKFSNSLKRLGVKKGDRVTIYLPMIPEAAIAMLACSRIGAIHSVVFGGFSPESLKNRIIDCKSSTI